ncbi:hypothetical protein [Nonomuraea sp. NPDC050310]|uniref:hypothetical protein n=1 Tax=Nonomuraea sp. NPDC050310 TaxID=3154935 RepID=UPI0033C5047A
MAYELPKDLIDLKRNFLRVDADCQKLSAALPFRVDVVALEAETDEDGMQHLAERRSERLELAEQINRHPWWGSLPADERCKASLELLAAARG